ncbi:PTS sugar transporter subunit IIC [Vagococcus sp. DIV0080]|uniref:Permease IIC component n=1 Tax=Candidatus Vagococcus giribetii TaxID=2230876 RepID=A0ABS3HQI8_9ENTE|nr:PTS transporter subunit EIIC [Vagococcus sp. DIV0080]MBO0476005.1 PTS sugar transporter subunit IIC [Vagococcus sp. DIV0080]
MQNFTSWLEKRIVPIAVVLNGNRFLAAIRDGFILTFPLTMATSIVALINSLILDPTSFLAKLLFLPKLFPNLADAQSVLSTVMYGTINIMSLFIVFLVAEHLAKFHEADSTTVGITALASFMIIYPKPQAFDERWFLTTDYLGAKGLFLAMIVGCLIGEFLPKLTNNKKLQIKMPEMVPPAVSRSFSALIPVLIIVLVSTIVAFIGTKFADDGMNQIIYMWIQTPLRKLGANIFGVYLITFMLGLLWFFGIHGPATLNPIISAIFSESDLMNSQHILSGQPLSEVPYPTTYGMLSGIYSYMGGAGMTLGLLIAILWVSKRKDYREVAKLGLIPAIFNINEPIIFGLPLVLNPILAVPFILTPIVSLTFAYIATVVLKVVAPAGIAVPWTIPGPIQSFLATGGTWQGLILGLVCLVSSVLIYVPFLRAADMYALKNVDK